MLPLLCFLMIALKFRAFSAFVTPLLLAWTIRARVYGLVLQRSLGLATARRRSCCSGDTCHDLDREGQSALESSSGEVVGDEAVAWLQPWQRVPFGHTTRPHTR